MSPKRIGRGDDRWERTPGGLFLPRRPTLPTRRYVMGLWGGIKDCCGIPCTICSSLRLEYDVTIAGLQNVTGCTDSVFTYDYSYVTITNIENFNRTWRVTYNAQSTVQNHSSGCGQFGGCEWRSVQYNTSVPKTHLYIRNAGGTVWVDADVSGQCFVYVTPNISSGIDVMVILYIAPGINVLYPITGLTCASTALHGQVLPYCASYLPDCDFGGSGSATIAAV